MGLSGPGPGLLDMEASGLATLELGAWGWSISEDSGRSEGCRESQLSTLFFMGGRVTVHTPRPVSSPLLVCDSLSAPSEPEEAPSLLPLQRAAPHAVTLSWPCRLLRTNS